MSHQLRFRKQRHLGLAHRIYRHHIRQKRRQRWLQQFMMAELTMVREYEMAVLALRKAQIEHREFIRQFNDAIVNKEQSKDDTGAGVVVGVNC
jgi:hypothetical protein